MKVARDTGVNLAYWLLKVHPVIFNALLSRARGARLGTFGALGDDGAPIITDTTEIMQGIDPSLVSMPDPEMTDIGVGAATADVSVPIDVSSAATPDVSLGGSLASALGSVGSFLTSATGLGAVTNLATAYYRANTPQAQTIATQVARVGAGATVAPITYKYNAQGQLVPVLSQVSGSQLPLSSQTLKSLVPSSWQQYALPVGVGLLLLWALTRSRS